MHNIVLHTIYRFKSRKRYRTNGKQNTDNKLGEELNEIETKRNSVVSPLIELKVKESNSKQSR